MTLPFPLSDPHFCARLTPEKLPHEPLIRAIRIKNLNRPTQIVDATAGLGRDLLILSASGAHVTGIENHPEIYRLLEALCLALKNSPAYHKLEQRIQLLFGDALEILPSLKPDLIYIDPMFANRSSARPKKEMAYLQSLTAPVDPQTEAQWLTLARSRAQFKVVVKRYKSMPPLAHLKPNHTICAPRVRYDVYLPTEGQLVSC